MKHKHMLIDELIYTFPLMYIHICKCSYGLCLSDCVTVQAVGSRCSVLPASEVGIAHRQVCLLQLKARSLEVRPWSEHKSSASRVWMRMQWLVHSRSMYVCEYVTYALRIMYICVLACLDARVSHDCVHLQTQRYLTSQISPSRQSHGSQHGLAMYHQRLWAFSSSLRGRMA